MRILKSGNGNLVQNVLKGIIGIVLFFIVLVRSTGVAFALTQVASNVGDLILNVISPIADAFGVIIIVVSVLMVLYAAFLYLTSAGDAAKIKQAGQTITYAAVGIVVALLSMSLAPVIASIMGVDLSQTVL